jgi:hypothetical protein
LVGATLLLAEWLPLVQLSGSLIVLLLWRLVVLL